MALNPAEIRDIQGMVARRGVHICVGIPVLMLLAALLLRKYLGFLADPIAAPNNLEVLGIAFLGVSAVDLAAAYLLKRRLLNPKQLKARWVAQPAEFGENLADAYVPVFVVAAAPALYGLIFYFLGGDLDTYVLISVFCPAGLLLLRPRDQEVERLVAEILGVPRRSKDDE